ncbi:MAG: hypothetical protein HY360_09415 [Verrucomicrobia bacterium]|nr:hypothetical protein [Verrucomicrobiota bacterium]
MDAYLSVDCQTCIIVAAVSTFVVTNRMIVISTRLSPQASIETSNRHVPNIFFWRPQRVSIRAPWKKTVADFVRLHRELCRAANQYGYRAVPESQAEFSDRFAGDIKEFYEDQVDVGRMKMIGTGEYQCTFKWALIAVPIVAWHSSFGLIFRNRPLSDDLIEERVRRHFENLSRQR